MGSIMRDPKTQLISQGADVVSLPQNFPFVYFRLQAGRGCCWSCSEGNGASWWHAACGSKEQSSGTCLQPEAHF